MFYLFYEHYKYVYYYSYYYSYYYRPPPARRSNLSQLLLLLLLSVGDVVGANVVGFDDGSSCCASSPSVTLGGTGISTGVGGRIAADIAVVVSGGLIVIVADVGGGLVGLSVGRGVILVMT